MLPEIILASSSVYRRALLDRLHLQYSCDAPNIDETALAGELPQTLSRRLAEEKAQALANKYRHHWIIGSDQVAALGDRLLGKPGDLATATEQLSACAGNSVGFYTAVCLLDSSSGNRQVRIDTTTVNFRNLTATEIEDYLHIEQPFDCAGSFKVEGLGITLFEQVQSADPTALMGLPLIALSTMLRAWGLSLPSHSLSD